MAQAFNGGTPPKVPATPTARGGGAQKQSTTDEVEPLPKNAKGGKKKKGVAIPDKRARRPSPTNGGDDGALDRAMQEKQIAGELQDRLRTRDRVRVIQ